MVEILSNFDWVLYVHSVRIEAVSIPQLSLLPRKVNIVGDVLQILKAVDDCVICPANEYATFAPLMDTGHSRVLVDASGM